MAKLIGEIEFHIIGAKTQIKRFRQLRDKLLTFAPLDVVVSVPTSGSVKVA